ncbi:MAG: hypothetical protein SFX18_09600 [Pirellulales bacterium]|nr:hypothetical protein [Pirellulales bacterium]
MTQQNLPPGWDAERIRKVLLHYETQTEDEQFAEIEAAFDDDSTIMMAVPAELVPEVRELLARRQSA